MNSNCFFLFAFGRFGTVKNIAMSSCKILKTVMNKIGPMLPSTILTGDFPVHNGFIVF